MKTGYSMTIRWFRRYQGDALDGTVGYHVQNRQQVLLARNWRALNAFHVTRLRVLSRADRLAAAIAAAQE